jgi:O-antigen/teichoic acid export membrane protein
MAHVSSDTSASAGPVHGGATQPAADSGFGAVFSLMSGRMIAFAATFFVPVVLARVFDPADFGTYKQALLIYATLYAIAPFGMADSLLYFLPLAPRAAGRYIVNSLLFLAAAGLICLALLGTASATIAEWLSNAALAEVVPLIGLYLLLMMVAAVLEIVLIATKRYRWTALSYAASDLLRAAFFLIPALLLHRLNALFVGAVAFAGLRAGVMVLYLTRQFRGALQPDPLLLRHQLAYAGPFGLAVLIEIVQSNFHQYAVAYHYDAASFAIYAVGCLQPPFVDFFLTPAASVMMVRMGEELAGGRRDVVPAIWRETTRKLALLLAPIVGAQLVAAREIIIVLFTATYLASVPIFMVWSVALLFWALLPDGVLRVYADTRFLLLLNVIRLLLILTLIAPFVLAFGLVGAALATVLVTVVTKAVALAKVRQLMGVDRADLLPWRSLGAVVAAAAAAMAPALILKSQLDLPIPLLLIVTVAVYGATYLALLVRLGILTDGERQAIRRWRAWPRLAGFRANESSKKG